MYPQIGLFLNLPPDPSRLPLLACCLCCIKPAGRLPCLSYWDMIHQCQTCHRLSDKKPVRKDLSTFLRDWLRHFNCSPHTSLYEGKTVRWICRETPWSQLSASIVMVNMKRSSSIVMIVCSLEYQVVNREQNGRGQEKLGRLCWLLQYCDFKALRTSSVSAERRISDVTRAPSHP